MAFRRDSSIPCEAAPRMGASIQPRGGGIFIELNVNKNILAPKERNVVFRP